MIKHTPKPWKLRRSSIVEWEILCDSNIPNIPGVVAKAGYKPNACLISAAPELLEACKEARKVLYSIEWTIDKTLEKIEYAIAKAEGK